MVIYPCHLAGFIASQTGKHPQEVHHYLHSKLPLGGSYLTSKDIVDLLNGYGATVPVGCTVAGGYLHI